MKKFLIAVIAIAASFCAKAQAPKDTTTYYYDTTKVFAWYINNLNTGGSTTSYVMKITRSTMQFAPPSQDQLKKDTLTVHKVKTPVAVAYYVPVVVADSAWMQAYKKNKKLAPKFSVIYSSIPSELILFDAGKNFDYLIPKPDSVKAQISKNAPKK